MPIIPSKPAISRLDIPPQKGLWRVLWRMRSPGVRRREFGRLMLDQELPPQKRFSRMRSLVDIGLWGDHAGETEILESLIERDGETGLAKMFSEMRSLLENPYYQPPGETEFAKDRRMMGFEVLVALNNGACPPDLVHLALEAGVDPNWRENNNHDDSLLTLFARRAMKPQFLLVLEAGADPSLKDSCNDTALHLLFKRAGQPSHKEVSLEMMEALLASGANINDHGSTRPFQSTTSNRPPLFSALESGTEILEWALSRGADVAAKDGAGNSAAHWATTSTAEAIECLELLHGRGADLQSTNNDNLTPLHDALQRRRKDVAAWLIDKGVRLDSHVDAPVSTSAADHVPSVLQLLVENLSRDEDATRLAQIISDRHPDCWNWASTRGGNIMEWAKENRHEWASVIQQDALEKTTIQPNPTSTVRHRL